LEHTNKAKDKARMNEEMINQLKALNKEFLYTEKGRKLLTKSIQLKKEWNESIKYCDFVVDTASVKMNLLHKKIQDITTELEVIPIGLNNMCHSNSVIFCQLSGMTRRLGYNITSCACGKKVCFELHSVNKYEGKLYDFTRDFNNEKTKYFMDLTDMDADTYINYLCEETNLHINLGCSCRITWGTNPNIKNITQTELLCFIENVKRTRIWC
jgi:hypothetical protein